MCKINYSILYLSNATSTDCVSLAVSLIFEFELKNTSNMVISFGKQHLVPKIAHIIPRRLFKVRLWFVRSFASAIVMMTTMEALSAEN